jgi:CheY-like chemotaxis protein
MARILIIDDDPTIQILFSQFLKSKGHTILQAEDGRKGISILKSQQLDLVITDIMMPEMDGLEILMGIRDAEIEIPVIAISGGMRDLPINFLRHAKLFGASYVFEKPVPLDILNNSVNSLLENPPEEFL